MNIIINNYRYIVILVLIIILFYLFYQYFLKFYNFYFLKYGYLMINEGICDKDCNNILLVINKELGRMDSEYTWNKNIEKI